MPVINPQIPKRKVIIADANMLSNDRFSRWFSQQADFQVAGVFNTPLRAREAIEEQDLWLVLVGLDIPNGIKICQMIRRTKPNLLLIGLVDQSQELNEALREEAAVSALLTRDSSSEEVARLIARLGHEEGPFLSVIMGMTGIKGGVGNSFLASTVGLALAEKFPEKVLLIDLHPGRGDLAFMLGLKSRPNLHWLLLHPDCLLPKVIFEHLQVTPKGLAVLASDQNRDPVPFNSEFLVALITILGNFYPYIVLDLPPLPLSGMMEILEFCDTIFLSTGSTPNQYKLAYQIITTDIADQPQSFQDRVHLVSRSADAGTRASLEKAFPRVFFLPEASYCDLAASATALPAGVRAGLEAMIESTLPEFKRATPPPSLIRYILNYFSRDRGGS